MRDYLNAITWANHYGHLIRRVILCVGPCRNYCIMWKFTSSKPIFMLFEGCTYSKVQCIHIFYRYWWISSLRGVPFMTCWTYFGWNIIFICWFEPINLYGCVMIVKSITQFNDYYWLACCNDWLRWLGWNGMAPHPTSFPMFEWGSRNNCTPCKMW